MLTKRGLYCLRITAVVLTLLCLLTLTLSFGTYSWLIYTLPMSDPAMMSGAGYTAHPELFYNRSGLFQTCYNNDSYAWLDMDKYSSSKAGKACLYEQGYHLDSYYATVEMYGEDYGAHIHMLRAHWALFVLGIVLIFIELILAIKRLWTQHFSFKEFLVAPSLAFLQAIAVAIGMGLFHIYINLENNKLNVDRPILPYYAFYSNSTNYANVAVMGYFGFSYYLGWVSVGLAFLAALVLAKVAREIYIQDLRMAKAIEAYPTQPGKVYRDEDTPKPGVIIPVKESKVYCANCGHRNKKSLFPSTEPSYGCASCGHGAEKNTVVWSPNTSHTITAEKATQYCDTCGGQMNWMSIRPDKEPKLRCATCGGKKKAKGMKQLQAERANTFAAQPNYTSYVDITPEQQQMYYCNTCGGKMNKMSIRPDKEPKLRCATCGGKKKAKGMKKLQAQRADVFTAAQSSPMVYEGTTVGSRSYLDYNQRNNTRGQFTFENPSWTMS